MGDHSEIVARRTVGQKQVILACFTYITLIPNIEPEFSDGSLQINQRFIALV
jgi:hypothetical protein